jgi:uncharacterized membrane protein
MSAAPARRPGGVSNARLLAIAAYLGGLMTGVIVLTVEKRDRFVRFHAMQSVVTFGTVLVAYLALTSLPVVGTLLVVPLRVGVVFLWLVLMLKAWSGESYKLPWAGDLAEHLLK